MMPLATLGQSVRGTSADEVAIILVRGKIKKRRRRHMTSRSRFEKALFSVVAFLISSQPMYASAQVLAILIEACSLLEPASKRVECLQVANRQVQGPSRSTTPQSAYSAVPNDAMSNSTATKVAPRLNHSSLGGHTCYVGPRGGTYTITKSGRKNYGGC